MFGLPAPFTVAKTAAVKGAAAALLLAAAVRVWWQLWRGVRLTPTGEGRTGTVPAMTITFWRVRMPDSGDFYACSEPCAQMIISRPWTPSEAEEVDVVGRVPRCLHCAACAELIYWPDRCRMHDGEPGGCPEMSGVLTVWVLEAARLWIETHRTPPTGEQIDKWAVYAAHGETDPAALIAAV